MLQLKTYGDERELAFCAFCGGDPATRDHCPSRVLLDEPYPDNLPVVGACAKCNSNFSADEEYLACLVGCVLAGSTDPLKIHRPKIQRILADKPALRSRIEQARAVVGEDTVFQAEMHRVHAVVTKLAQGHALYELHLPCRGKPTAIGVKPLALMTDREREHFEFPTAPLLWPEVGSRAMQRLLIDGASPDAPWIVVQEGMYRLHVSPANGVQIRIVINEYLACHVPWE